MPLQNTPPLLPLIYTHTHTYTQHTLTLHATLRRVACVAHIPGIPHHSSRLTAPAPRRLRPAGPVLSCTAEAAPLTTGPPTDNCQLGDPRPARWGGASIPPPPSYGRRRPGTGRPGWVRGRGDAYFAIPTLLPYPAPCWGGGVWTPPLRFFEDSEKTAARSAAGFSPTLPPIFSATFVKIWTQCHMRSGHQVRSSDPTTK